MAWERAWAARSPGASAGYTAHAYLREGSVASSRHRAQFAHHMGCGEQRANTEEWWSLPSQELIHLTHVHAVKVTSQDALNYITPFLVEALGL